MNSIRKMKKEDISVVCEMERASFSTPWSQESFESELKKPNAHYFVWELNREIIGYAGFWIVLEEAGITNIAVKESERGKGYGKGLTAFLLREAARLGAEAVTLEVRESNAAAISVYQKNGFTVAGVRKDYYVKPTENALIMWAKVKKEESYEQGTKSN